MCIFETLNVIKLKKFCHSLGYISFQNVDPLWKHFELLFFVCFAEETLILVTCWHQEVAKRVGEIIAKSCLEKGIMKVAFDRGGYPYHGRVEALAEAAREHGLQFWILIASFVHSDRLFFVKRTLDSNTNASVYLVDLLLFQLNANEIWQWFPYLVSNGMEYI